jgi:hypothetical protein
MGRHSASSDDGDEAAVAAAADESAAVLTGRHARIEQPPAAAPESDEEPLVSLEEVAADDGPLGLIAEQMTEPGEPPVDVVPEFAEPALEPVEPVEPVEPAAPVEPNGSGRGNQSTAADLALLRAHSDVRARVIAALVVPFLLYTAVLYLVGGLGVYLIWIWIPLVGAGVVAGSILDAEHRRRARSSDR